MLISQLSKKTGIPVHTIRYYEKYGLFKGSKDTSVKSNNYTYYDEETISKLELIKEAKEIGFTLAEIKKLIDAWHSKRLSVEKKKEIIQLKIKEIEDKIGHLKSVKNLLIQGIKEIEQLEC